MNTEAYIDEIKLKVSGGVLKLEIDDAHILKILNSCLREIQRYIDSTEIITIPYATCIDLSKYNINSISSIYRANPLGSTASNKSNTSQIDPMWATQWQMLSGADSMYNFNNYVMNFASYNTLQQLRNTLSTDLAYYYDAHTSKLYINNTNISINEITIEYVPRYTNIEDITSDYWIDVLLRMAIAQTKVILGRIRSRYTQTNALWTQDGETLLAEGTAELEALRETLSNFTSLNYPID